MIAQWLSPAAEQAELRVLNERLRDYVRRVGELERENRRLEAAVRLGTKAHGEGARGSRCAQEARGLRRQLDELGQATVRAESECGVLRRELEELRELSGETRAARGRLDAELGAQRRELEDALAERAALEALLGRLEAERGHLAASHEHQMRELRARAEAAASRPLQVRSVAAAAPCALPLQEVQAGCARLVAEAWDETVRLYEGQVWELSEALRRDQESRRQAEEEARRGAREAQALRQEVMELEGLQVRLEDELRRMHEAFELQAQEGQVCVLPTPDDPWYGFRAPGTLPPQCPPLGVPFLLTYVNLGPSGSHTKNQVLVLSHPPHKDLVPGKALGKGLRARG